MKEFPGLEQMQAHVPELRRRGGSLLVALYVLGNFALVALSFVLLDAFWPQGTLVTQFAVLGIGFFWLSRFILRHAAFTQKWGKQAYRNAFVIFCVPGLALILSAVIHIAYMPGPVIPLGWWSPGVVTLGLYFLAVGFAIWARTIFAFGFDNLAMLYVYFPAEGRLVDTALYATLRHPTYAAVIRFGLGMALLNGNWFALAFALFMPLGMTIWLRLVEEKELLERFGAGYAEYRKKVPAFWPRPKDYGRFWKFLVTGK
jgi:protein-S-isoprenylcysteine O-methyltransferase Ste14